MRVHTNDFKEEINKMGRQITGKIYYYPNLIVVSEDNKYIVSEGSSFLASELPNFENKVEITEDIFSISIIKNGSFLTSLMKECDFEAKKDLPIGTIINPHFGVLVNGEYEFLNYGNFIIKDKQYNFNNETWTYVCFDKMLFSMVDYKELNLTYPTTLDVFLNKICEKIGVEFVLPKSEDGQLTYVPDNYYIAVLGDLFKEKKVKYRDVLDKISEILGGNLLINDNDQMTIGRFQSFPNEPLYKDTFDEKFLKDNNISFGEKVGPIYEVAIIDTETNLEYRNKWPNLDDEMYHEIKIYDNEFAFNGQTELIARGILNAVAGLEFYYNDFATTGICYLDYLDRYYINFKNKQYPCILFNNEITITTGIEENIFTEESEQTKNIQNEYSTSILNSKETSFIVNKQQGEIKSKVSKNSIISTINQSAEQIQINANKISLEGKEINLKTENVEFFSEVHDKYQYTNEDMTRLNDIVNNGATPTSEEIEKYDLDHDGILTRTDLLWIQSKIFGYSPTSGTIKITGKDTNNIITTTSNTSSSNNLTTKIGLENIETNASTFKILNCLQSIALNSGTTQTIFLAAASGNITCVSLTQTSKKSEKKNFEKLKNAKEILNQVDIYKYNFKGEDDNVKKSIGFVIGDDFNYSKEITSKNNDGVNIYSMVSVLWQVVKEQQEEISQLKEMIKKWIDS